MAKSGFEHDASTRLLMARLWRDWLRPMRGRIVVALALMAVVAGATGLYPLVIKETFDRLEAADATVYTLIPALIVAITAIKGGALYLQSVQTQAIVLRVIANIQKAMFAHLTAADYARLIRNPTGTLISRFTVDTQMMRESLSRVITNLVRDLLTVIALVAAMFYLDWQLSLVVLLAAPILIPPITTVGRRIRRVARGAQEHIGDIAALLEESLSGARMVKTYRLEHYEQARANAAFEHLYNMLLRIVRIRSSLDPVLEVIGGLAVAGVVAFAGWRVVQGESSVATLIAFIGAVLTAAQSIRALGTLNAVLQQGLAAMQRVFALLDERPQIIETPAAPAIAIRGGEIRFENISFSYATTEAEAAPEPALNGVSFTVPAGQTVALVGPSGAGKSTVLNLLPRLYQPDSGRVLIDGQAVPDVSLASLRDAIAFVSQDAVIFHDTLAANIAFGRPNAHRQAIEAAAKAAAAHNFIMRMPEGYDTIVGAKGATLSGGERQRLALARALLKAAPILLLDEATSALDAESERHIQAALARLSESRTTLVIAHRLTTVQHADKIIVLEHGRVVETGTHSTLLARGGVYQRLCALQAFAT